MTALLYVYAILPATASAVTMLTNAALQGIDGAAVGGIGAAGLVAAASAVPTAEFEMEPLNALVRSLDWLGPRAALHQAVNAQLFAQSDAMIPLAFGTVYRDRSSVTAMLVSQQQALVSALDRVRDRAEWVVSLERHVDQALAALENSSAALRDLRAGIAGATPGRAYLLSRQVDAVQRRELQARDAQAVDALETLLSNVDRAVAEPLDSGSETGTLARLSLLVRRAGEADWLAAVRAYQQQWQGAGYELRLTGPWPPYRFSSRGPEVLHAGS